MVSLKLGQSTRTTKAKFISVSPQRKIQEMQFRNLPVFVPFSM